jgi:hypothetical protein
MPTVEKVNFQGWPNCYRLSNKIFDLIVTTDVGPRVVWLGFSGGVNEFLEIPADAGKTGGNEWRAYGGHRLWHAPEAKPRTYFPDNSPVKLKQRKGGFRVTQNTETTTGIQKEIDFEMAEDQAMVKLTHRLTNQGLWPVELAVWALSVMAPGGVGVFPLPERGPHTENLLPKNAMALWAYTNMSDPRWTWGEKYILLRQDARAEKPQKIGLMDMEGWAAYANHNNLFVKLFDADPEALYPDFGCSVESFTNADMLELETVGPFALLEPGDEVEHVEYWYLFKGVSAPKNDADVEKTILPKIAGL